MKHISKEGVPMARSYKKSPVVTDRSRPKTAKFFKRQSNKKVRRYNHALANGSAFRKVMETWEIRDYVNRWSKEQALHDYRHSVYFDHRNGEYRKTFEEYGSEKQFLDRYWKKIYRRK